MILAAHQINFCPWQSFFQKIEQADVFVLMVHTQFRKGGYESRFKLNDKWYGMSVNRGLQPLFQKKYVNVEKDWDRLLKTFPKFKVFDDCIAPELMTNNVNIILRACEILNIKTELKYDYQTSLRGTERLIDICVRYGADKYLSGISGKNYLDLSLFDKAGIEVIFQDESKMDKRPLVDCL